MTRHWSGFMQFIVGSMADTPAKVCRAVRKSRQDGQTCFEHEFEGGSRNVCTYFPLVYIIIHLAHASSTEINAAEAWGVDRHVPGLSLSILVLTCVLGHFRECAPPFHSKNRFREIKRAHVAIERRRRTYPLIAEFACFSPEVVPVTCEDDLKIEALKGCDGDERVLDIAAGGVVKRSGYVFTLTENLIQDRNEAEVSQLCDINSA
ncbi:hypothetical protein C8J57DRAFT_1221789 [Mycena rebaudengoi]|nr:hypothetical protein C8J57DRAFT_1221789 [Mycena rebaudengoi]